MDDATNSLKPPFVGPGCPRCGAKTEIVGGFNAVSYISCSACGYYGDNWEDSDGVAAVLAGGPRFGLGPPRGWSATAPPTMPSRREQSFDHRIP
jgi:hypothetical protein